MKKMFFGLTLMISCIAPASYSMQPAQRALMATKSLKEHAALAAIQKIYAECHGDRKAIEDTIRGEPYSTLDLSPLLAKYWFLIYGAVKDDISSEDERDFIAPELEYSYSIDELRVFNKLPTPSVEDVPLFLIYLRIADLAGLHNIPNIANVTHILLWGNRIEALQPNIFNGHHCEMIDLGRNRLTGLDPAVFNGLDNKFRQLCLAENPLAPESFDIFINNLLGKYPQLGYMPPQ